MGIFDRLFGNKPEPPPPAPEPQSAAPAPAAAPAPGSGIAWPRISEDEWDDWDDPQKLEYCKRVLELLKGAYGGGKLRKVTSNDEVQLRITVGGHPATVVIDYDSGWLELKMKFVNRRGWLRLDYDADKRASDFAADPNDEWEEDDEGGQVVKVFADGVYVEEFEYEATPMIALFEAAPAALRTMIIESLQRRTFTRLFVDAEVIEVGLDPDIYEIPDLKLFCDERFAILGAVAKYFGEGTESITPKPRVYIQGRPVAPNQPPQRITCAYCSTPYTLDDDPRCPSCGAVGQG